MGQIRTRITLSRLSADHQLLEKREQPSRSWVKHFFDLLYPPLYFESNTLAGVNDITVAPRTLGKIAGANRCFLCNLGVISVGGAGQMPVIVASASPTISADNPIQGENLGIVVGSNATPVTPTDDKLNTKIAQGGAGGQLLYGGCEIYGLVFADPNGEMRIRRYFTNKSAGNVTVREAGIYSPGFIDGSHAYAFCIARDLTGDIVIADTQILEVEYTVQITV